VLRGPGGVGKTMVAQTMLKFFGAHGMKVSQSDHLVGKFNAHLAAKVVLSVEEAIWAGDKKAGGVLKAVTDGTPLAIERKGVDTELAQNFLRLIFSSNEEFVVPAAQGAERRWFVLDVTGPKADQRKAYFDALFAQLESGGYEAMLHDLLNHDYTGIDLREAPSTKGLDDQRMHSLSPREQWLHAVLHEGQLGVYALNEDQPTEVSTDEALASIQEFTRGAKRKIAKPALGTLLGKFGVKRERGKAGGPVARDKRVYTIPPLSEIRATWQSVMKCGDWAE
jgi:Family of unknown function (DUF5906)